MRLVQWLTVLAGSSICWTFHVPVSKTHQWESHRHLTSTKRGPRPAPFGLEPHLFMTTAEPTKPRKYFGRRAERPASEISSPTKRPSIEERRGSRELAMTIVYQGLLTGCSPLDILEGADYEEYFFGGDLADKLQAAGKEDEPSRAAAPKPLPQNSALLRKRAERSNAHLSRPETMVDMWSEDEEEGELVETAVSEDHRGVARQQEVVRVLEQLESSREHVEEFLRQRIDERIAETMAATTMAVMLVHMSEMDAGLPAQVACSEAVEMAKGYCGGGSFKYVNAILGEYGRVLQS